MGAGQFRAQFPEIEGFGTGFGIPVFPGDFNDSLDMNGPNVNHGQCIASRMSSKTSFTPPCDGLIDYMVSVNASLIICEVNTSGSVIARCSGKSHPSYKNAWSYESN